MFKFKSISGVVALVLLMGCNEAGAEKSVEVSAKPEKTAEVSSANAGTTTLAAKSDLDELTLEQRITLNLTKMGLAPKSIEPSPVPGLSQVLTARGLFYYSEQGNYLLHGTMYNIDEKMKNETDSALVGHRVDEIDKLKDGVIEYKADDEKYVVNVFTDISCGYCRKLHKELADYNEAGITVRYLAYPRGGLEGRSYTDMVKIWCAKDQQQALDEAKINQVIVANEMCQSPVDEHYKIGSMLGVSGTPAIILSDGTMVPGYKPADALLRQLQKGS